MVPIPIPGLLFVTIPGIGISIGIIPIPIPVSVLVSVWMFKQYRYGFESSALYRYRYECSVWYRYRYQYRYGGIGGTLVHIVVLFDHRYLKNNTDLSINQFSIFHTFKAVKITKIPNVIFGNLILKCHTTESRKRSNLSTNLIQKYIIFLLLGKRDNQIRVLNSTILLSKIRKR